MMAWQGRKGSGMTVTFSKPVRPVELRDLDMIMPAPENDLIYGAASFDDPLIHELARSIKKHGIREPILISRDGFILSGHRRRLAAQIAGLKRVPVRIEPLSRGENPDAFKKLLVEMNSQRVKSTSVQLRESLIKIDPKIAVQKIVNDRKTKERERVFNSYSLSVIDPALDGRRCDISEAKRPFLDAINRVLEEQREYWPLSDRQIHYRLLNDPPLTHASKPDSKYVNDRLSYRKLIDLAARGRVAGLIPWESIDDETRPVDLHAAFWNPAHFFRQKFGGFLKGYWRNRLQSQPHHVEIVGEKLTVRTILQKVAQEFTMPLTISRGMSSLPPKKAIRDRYKHSQKDKLILFVVSDLDPAGDAIAEDVVKSFRRDFGITKIVAYKVALTIEQVEQFGLEPSMEANDDSPTYKKFVAKYRITDAYELEAMDASGLAGRLESAIKDVIDLDLFNQELAAEEADSAQIIAVQEHAAQFFQSLNLY
jgi:ParB-like nuclease domain